MNFLLESFVCFEIVWTLGFTEDQTVEMAASVAIYNGKLTCVLFFTIFYGSPLARSLIIRSQSRDAKELSFGWLACHQNFGQNLDKLLPLGSMKLASMLQRTESCLSRNLVLTTLSNLPAWSWVLTTNGIENLFRGLFGNGGDTVSFVMQANDLWKLWKSWKKRMKWLTQ